jgi:hypothetical protein
METSDKKKKANDKKKNLAKGKQVTMQNKPGSQRATAITYADENDITSLMTEDSSNVGQGPAIENL